MKTMAPEVAAEESEYRRHLVELASLLDALEWHPAVLVLWLVELVPSKACEKINASVLKIVVVFGKCEATG